MSPKRTESGNMLPRYGAKSKIRGRVLNEDEMTFLRDKPYIYNAFNDSFLELLFLQQFWTYITDLIPQWVAPCVLTGYGLAINITTCLILLHYSVGNTEETPSWTFVLAAIGVFVYQTLDGIDGKVAIRVQNTPIEEVYDHGCDAVSAVFITLAAAVTLQLYSYPVLTLLCLLMSSIAFFSTHWLCHVKHQMIFGRVDIAESQFFIIAIHIVTACFGQSLWHAHLATIWAFRLRIVHVIAFGTVVGLLLATFKNVNLAVLGAKTPLEEMGIHIPVRQAPMIWSSLVPMTTITLLAVWAFKFGYLVASPTAFYISFGLAYAKVTIVLLMKNVSYGNMEMTDTVLIPPLFVAFNTIFSFVQPTTALNWSLFFTIVDIVRYGTYASWDFQDALNLYIFSIKYAPGHLKCRNGPCGLYFHALNKEDVLRYARANLPAGYDGIITIDLE